MLPATATCGPEGYDRELRDILSLQDEVASQVARQVRVALTPQDRARLSAARPVNPEAYLFYVRGRADMQRWTRNTWETARQNFRQAIEKDPAYALAYAGLAESYVTGDNSLDPKVSIPLARAAAAKALALDDTVSDAHVASAQIRSLEDWDWSGGEEEFKRAIELNPGDTLAHHLYSHLLLVLGRLEESLRESKLYVELDPVSPAAYDHLGFHYVIDGQNDLAILALQKAAQLDPSWEGGYRDLGNAYRRKGMAQEALHQYEQAMRVDGVEPQSIEALRRAFSSGGWNGYWKESLNQQLRNHQHRYVDPYGIAVLYALLGDKENAFRYLDLAYSSHDDSLAYIRADYDLSSLHTDPRYSALLQRMRLPQ
jgi:tetratricopeptide (TPR) repeat protein